MKKSAAQKNLPALVESKYERDQEKEIDGASMGASTSGTAHPMETDGALMGPSTSGTAHPRLRRKGCKRRRRTRNVATSTATIPMIIVQSPSPEAEATPTDLTMKPEIKVESATPEPTLSEDLPKKPEIKVESATPEPTLSEDLPKKPEIKVEGATPEPTLTEDLPKKPEIKVEGATPEPILTEDLPKKPEIKVEKASPDSPREDEDLPKMLSKAHLTVPSHGKMTPGELAKRHNAKKDFLAKITIPRPFKVLSLQTSPVEPDVYTPWYLRTHYDDLFKAAAAFKNRNVVPKPAIKVRPVTKYDELLLTRYKLHAEVTREETCCCDSWICRMCRRLTTRRSSLDIPTPRRSSLDIPTPRQVPEHPRALYAVRPTDPFLRRVPLPPSPVPSHGSQRSSQQTPRHARLDRHRSFSSYF